MKENSSFIRFLKDFPLALLLIFTWAVIAIGGFLFTSKEGPEHVNAAEALSSKDGPYISGFFKSLESPDPMQMPSAVSHTASASSSETAQMLLSASSAKWAMTGNDPSLAEEEEIEEVIEEVYEPFVWVPLPPIEPRSEFYDDVGGLALTTPADYHLVGDSYFDDALFIGDSRIEGMSLASGLPNADYLYSRGGTISAMFEPGLWFVHNGTFADSDSSIEKVMKNFEYNKFYICIGINGVGWTKPDEFQALYQEFIDLLLSYRPDATIFICSIMNVSTAYSESTSVTNNDNINARNFRIAQLANGQNIFYLDENTVFNDETGGLNPELSNDAIHLKAQYYVMFSDFLREHGI